MKADALVGKDIAVSKCPGKRHSGSRGGHWTYESPRRFVENRTNRRVRQGETNVIVQLPPLAEPTVTRPALSLPPMEGEVPQSLDPEPTAGVAPVVI